jgi:fermentation-respiration switch protein FrsA (DUF1100 family)
MAYLLLVFIAAYIGIVSYLYVWQRQLIYHPDTAIESPDHYVRGFTEYFVKTPDDVSIQLWYHPATQGFPTIIYYHGNAAHMGLRAGMYGSLMEKGFGVLGVEYRGFGKSSGSPTEQGLYIDARTAMAFLTDTQHIPLKRIIIFGESLGTGVAVQMATEYDAGALVLQSAYTSVSARAAEIYYYIPVRMLIHDKFDTIDKIARVKAPLLLYHGELDNVIPIRMGKAVFAAATSPKESIYFPDRAHNNFDTRVISEHVLDFATRHHLIDN